MAKKANDAKKPEIKEAVKAAPAPVEEKAPAKTEVKAEPKKAVRKPAAKKAAPAKKEEAKVAAASTPVEVKEPVKAETKAEPKTTGKKTAAKKAATAKKAAAPAKAEKKAPATKKVPAKAAKIVTTSVLQVAGNEFDFDKVVKAVEGLKKKNEGKSLEIYVKPEDRAIYYVVNGKGGKKIDI